MATRVLIAIKASLKPNCYPYMSHPTDTFFRSLHYHKKNTMHLKPNTFYRCSQLISAIFNYCNTHCIEQWI